jgi:transmembrane sensor
MSPFATGMSRIVREMRGRTRLNCIFGQHRTEARALHDQTHGRPGGDDSVDPSLVERMLGGDASLGERVALGRWAGDDEDRLAIVARIESAAEGLRQPRYDVDAAWEAVSRRMQAPSARAAIHEAHPLERPASPHWLANTAGIAAAALICVIAGAIALRSLRPATEQASATTSPGAPQVAITGRGQRLAVTLRDGSHVTLAPNSRLTAPAAFGHTTREVTLDGKAYFDVAHDSAYPFTVIAGGSRIRDLGTQFVVEAYTRDPNASPGVARSQTRMQVAVASGVVRIESPPPASAEKPWVNAVGDGGATIVTAGEIARVDARGQTTIVPHADVASMKGWTSGELVFDRSSLGDVARELERWYDIDIVISDPALAQRRISKTFRGMPISHVLNTLALAVDARCWWSGRTVTISPLVEGNEPPI